MADLKHFFHFHLMRLIGLKPGKLKANEKYIQCEKIKCSTGKSFSSYMYRLV